MKSEVIFVLNKKIPFCSIFPGSIITKINNRYYCDNTFIPFMTDLLIDQYCLRKTVYAPEYPENTHCVVSIDNSFYGCKICKFDTKTGKYTVRYKAKGKDKWENDVSEDRLKPFEEYYFLSSSGIVQKDYLYRDIETENWRKKVRNFFLDKKDCIAYREGLISNDK